MIEYGLSGSATYAVSFDSLDKMIDVLPDNDVNQITAQNIRDTVFTLWLHGGGGGGSFSYTQTAPLSQGSVNTVGGLAAGTTFSNVSLQDLLDRMFFPAEATGYNITANPASLELGYPNIVGQDPTTTISVSLTRKSNEIKTANASFNGVSLGTVNIPNTYNDVQGTTFNNVLVTQNTTSTYILTLNDGTTKTDSASVTWYFPGWFGSVDLSSNGSFTPLGSFDFRNATAGQITTFISIMSGPSNLWTPVWQSSGVTNFTKKDSEPNSTGSFGSVGHKVLIIPISWYGDGVPTGFKSNNSDAAVFKVLDGQYTVKNQYGYSFQCKILVSYIQTAGSSSYDIVP